MKLLLIVLDAFFLMRPVLWVPVWAFCAFGYWRAVNHGTGMNLLFLWDKTHIPPFGWMALFSCSVGAVYVVNQIADIGVDKKNQGFPLLANGVVSRRTAWLCAGILPCIAVAGTLPFHPRIAVVSLAALIVGLLYSFKPVYLSGRPVVDFLANALGYGVIAFGAGWIIGGGRIFSVDFFRASVPYFLLMSSGSICSTFPDYQGDKAAGKHTTAVVFGRMNALVLAGIILAIACCTAVYSGDWAACTAGAAAFPLYIMYGVKKNNLWMEASYKVAGAVLVLTIAVLYPPIIAPSCLAFLATRLYFRHRHGIVYPSLTAVPHEKQ